MTDHRATFVELDDGRWRADCTTCGTTVIAGKNDVWAWCNGHNSAVVCAQTVAERADPVFPPVGPGEAVKLSVLCHTLGQLVAHGLGELEIVAPLGQARRLHVLTTPTEEGWCRARVGEISLRADGEFHAYPLREDDLVSGSPTAIDQSP